MIPLNVRMIPPMKTIRQRALVVVSERIKPFSPRLEPLSIKLADSVRLTDCSIGQAPARHCRLLRGEGGKGTCATHTPKNRSRIRWNTVRIFQGREQRRYLAIVRLSRKVSVRQEVMWFSSPCPGGLNIKRSAAWVCELDYSRRRLSSARCR